MGIKEGLWDGAGGYGAGKISYPPPTHHLWWVGLFIPIPTHYPPKSHLYPNWSGCGAKLSYMAYS